MIRRAAAALALSLLPSTTIMVLSLDSAVVAAAAGRKVRMTTFNVDGPMVRVQGAVSLRAASRPARSPC